MNLVVLIGRMTKDCELRYSAGGTAFASFTLAVDRYSKDKEKQADFISCIAFGKTAENTAEYTAKGSLVAVEGRIQTRNYEAKDGTKKYVTEVAASQVKFLSRKDSGGGQADHRTHEDMGFTDEDIPF